MKIRQSMAIVLSGALWMGVGVFLMMKGFSLVLSPVFLGSKPPLLSWLYEWTGSFEQAAFFLICLGMMIGFLKGRLVLSKTASRVIRRIVSLPNPCSIASIYPPSYLLILSSMVLLGISFKWMPIPYDIKGLIDVAVGSALINGSAFYFRHFVLQGKGVKK